MERAIKYRRFPVVADAASIRGRVTTNCCDDAGCVGHEPPNVVLLKYIVGTSELAPDYQGEEQNPKKDCRGDDKTIVFGCLFFASNRVRRAVGVTSKHGVRVTELGGPRTEVPRTRNFRSARAAG